MLRGAVIYFFSHGLAPLRVKHHCESIQNVSGRLALSDKAIVNIYVKFSARTFIIQSQCIQG